MSGFLAALGSSFLLAQQQGGNLAPPGAPGATGKSLAEIDPGTALEPADFGVIGITISSPGHYYLTGNVTTVPATAAAVTIASADVTLDLRGFAIVSSGGAGAAEAQSAIFVSSSTHRNLTIRNGHIRGNWFGGVHAKFSSQIRCENIQVAGTGSYGIRLGTGAQVTGCHVEGGTTPAPVGFVAVAGIDVSANSLVDRSTVARCDGAGIATIQGCSILDCAAYNNGIQGIKAGIGCTVSRCTAYDNVGSGFETGSGCSLLNCSAVANGLEGFHLTFSCVVTGCVASGNDDNGFSGTSGNIFSNCVSRSNGQNAANAAADGFEVNNDTRICDCLSAGNEGAGVLATSNINYFRGNYVRLNEGGGFNLTNASNVVIGNYVVSNTGFDINQSGGDIGPFENASTGTSPNANFQ